MHGIHTPGRWGRTSSLLQQPHARDLHIYKWGRETPLHPAKCPVSRYFLRIWGCGEEDPCLSCTANAESASRHDGDRGLSAWRLEHLTRTELGEGSGNPRVSQFVREEGARFRSSAGPGTEWAPCHAPLHPHPIPGPQGKEEAPEPHSHVPFPSRTKPHPCGRTEDYSRKLRQRARCEKGDCPLRGPHPLARKLLSAQHLLLSGSQPRGAPYPPPTHSPNSQGTLSCLPVSSQKGLDSAFSAPTSCRWVRR